MIELHVNGQIQRIDAEDDMPLLWALREQCGLTGTKYGFGIAACGACTVHIDGQPVRACQMPVGQVGKASITTIEGLGKTGLHAVQQAWIAEDVPQCGYCQSGQIMAAVALLASKPAPTDADIDQAMDNICRCGTYERIRRGIHRAAAEIARGTQA